MERFSFICQVSATYWSIHQSSVSQCINQVQITLQECSIIIAVNTPYKTQDLKFKECKS